MLVIIRVMREEPILEVNGESTRINKCFVPYVRQHCSSFRNEETTKNVILSGYVRDA